LVNQPTKGGLKNQRETQNGGEKEERIFVRWLFCGLAILSAQVEKRRKHTAGAREEREETPLFRRREEGRSAKPTLSEDVGPSSSPPAETNEAFSD